MGLPANPDDDTKDQAHARAAEESGKLRNKTLQSLAKANRWIRPLFAQHTFEVDFIEAQNAYEVVKTLDGIYSKPVQYQTVDGAP